MLNLEIGEQIGPGGKLAILTKVGAQGHAVWGGYDQHPPGKYCAAFEIDLHDHVPPESTIVAHLEILAAISGEPIATESITIGHLLKRPLFSRLFFELAEPRVLMFRLYATGAAPLIVGAFPLIIPVSGDERAIETQITARAFPDPNRQDAPRFLVQNAVLLRQIHDLGANVSVEKGDVIVNLNNSKIFARESDDLTFVPEVFNSNTYNFKFAKPTCVIDVGMNIGLATLFFAAKENVREVYSFEPFKGTFDRAVANIALNPVCAEKIRPYNYGLGGRDEEVTVTIPSGQLSGANSARGGGGGAAGSGDSLRIAIRDAASVMRPIIERAQKSGLSVVAKIDCEGSEFSIFESLEAAGLLSAISAFMVEWHRGYTEKTQHDLLAPLLRSGFLAFDVTPNNRSAGNGFFYAVRCAT